MSDPIESGDYIEPFEPAPEPPEPIRSPAEALRLIRMVLPRPLKSCTIGFALGDDGIGDTITVAKHHTRRDLFLEVTDHLALISTAEGFSTLVMASVRGGSGRGRAFLGDLLPGDVDRWLEASSICEGHGIRLLDWFVIGHGGIQCPRDLLGEPSRWPS